MINIKDLIQEINDLEKSAIEEISQASDDQSLLQLKAVYLGKKSKLQEINKSMRDLGSDARKTLGKEANEFRCSMEKAIQTQKEAIIAKHVNRRIASETIDVTMPGKNIKNGHMHPLYKTIREVEDIFVGMGYKVAEGPEVEEDLYNFELLNLPKGHPAREMQDTFYIDQVNLLRTHTSPVQAHALLKAKGKPVKIICPGKVYRRDNDDATHSHQFMQCEGLVVGENITMSDLKGTLEEMVKHVFGDSLNVRFRPSFFPFTEPSVEVDVECFKCHGAGCALCKGSGWIEVLGAGMVHPNVLKMTGYDTSKYQGFAFGVGIERIAMLKYGIDDIRHFYTNDERFLKQF